MAVRILFAVVVLYGSLNTELRAQGTLFIFYDTECPICQKSSKRLQEMYVRFGQNVAFKAVFPTKSIKKSTIRQFSKEYNFTLPYVIDRTHTFVERYNAKTTPEVVLLDKNGTEIYRGAIDNQFFGLGKYRPQTTEFYLQNALEAFVSNRPVTPNHTEAVGCLINRKKKESVKQSL